MIIRLSICLLLPTADIYLNALPLVHIVAAGGIDMIVPEVLACGLNAVGRGDERAAFFAKGVDGFGVGDAFAFQPLNQDMPCAIATVVVVGRRGVCFRTVHYELRAAIAHIGAENFHGSGRNIHQTLALLGFRLEELCALNAYLAFGQVHLFPEQSVGLLAPQATPETKHKPEKCLRLGFLQLALRARQEMLSVDRGLVTPGTRVFDFQSGKWVGG